MHHRTDLRRVSVDDEAFLVPVNLDKDIFVIECRVVVEVLKMLQANERNTQEKKKENRVRTQLG